MPVQQPVYDEHKTFAPLSAFIFLSLHWRFFFVKSLSSSLFFQVEQKKHDMSTKNIFLSWVFFAQNFSVSWIQLFKELFSCLQLHLCCSYCEFLWINFCFFPRFCIYPNEYLRKLQLLSESRHIRAFGERLYKGRQHETFSKGCAKSLHHNSIVILMCNVYLIEWTPKML